ncbi:MAG: hypothetical protein CUN55_14790 [Phototrophicales bacterium]|nr:MAG: hypothetical protein CUN55_14790 [Phototrophicales bacterium]
MFAKKVVILGFVKQYFILVSNEVRTHGDILRESGVVFLLRLLGVAAGFGFNVVLARVLGAEGAGLYFLAVTVLAIATVFGRMGLDSAMLRFVASNAALGRWERVAGVYREGFLSAIVASMVVTGVIFVGAPFLASRVFHEPLLVTPIRVITLAITPFSLFTLYAEMLKGLKRSAAGVVVQSVSVPLLGLLLVLVLAPRYGVAGAVIAYVSAVFIALALGAFLWRRAVPQIHGLSASSFDRSVLWATSMPLFGVSVINLAMNWSGTLALGIWADPKDVGLYGIANRTVMLLNFILATANVIVSPRFADQFARGNRQGLTSLFLRSVAVMGVVSLIPVLLFISAPSFVLSLFGHEFAAASPLLVILVIGQFVNVLAGSVGPLLIMTGHERVLQSIMLRSALVFVVLTIYLTYSYGAIGAAFASTVNLVVLNLLGLYAVQKHLHIFECFSRFLK